VNIISIPQWPESRDLALSMPLRDENDVHAMKMMRIRSGEAMHIR
jgi:hypothetical protein